MREHHLGTLHLPSGRLSVSDPMVTLGRPEDGERYGVTGSIDGSGNLLAVHVDFGVEPL